MNCRIERPRVIFIVGPTAAGKTAVGIEIARKLGGEMISCDSMQIYRGMKIISSAPSAVQMRAVRHHLVGIIAPTTAFDVSRYRKRAVDVMKDIIRRKKTPVFVGGTGMYMTVLLDGIFTSAPSDPALRRRLGMFVERYGSQRLHARLAKADPPAASRIHPNDARRIIRALEVNAITGKRISSLQPQRTGLAGEYDVRVFCLTMPREELYRRVEERIDRMAAGGLAGEVRRLLSLKLSLTARYAIGLQELRGYCDGTIELGEAIELMKKNTRHYAKRQLTWFRKDKRIVWVEAGEHSTAKGIAKDIVSRIK